MRHFALFVHVILAAASAPALGWAQAAPEAATATACPALLQHSFDRLQDEKPQSLCQYSGKVILVVNTASFCGFTPQYKGLEQLHARYRDRGFVVLGFPSNDFAQEKGSNQEIADFCESTFGVSFPMFTKSSVRGSAANPFFKQLAGQGGGAPLWNFHKYLIGRNGEVVASYPSTTGPLATTTVRAIEQQLAMPATR
jgi:glutathione peroxidase